MQAVGAPRTPGRGTGRSTPPDVVEPQGQHPLGLEQADRPARRRSRPTAAPSRKVAPLVASVGAPEGPRRRDGARDSPGRSWARSRRRPRRPRRDSSRSCRPRSSRLTSSSQMGAVLHGEHLRAARPDRQPLHVAVPDGPRRRDLAGGRVGPEHLAARGFGSCGPPCPLVLSPVPISSAPSRRRLEPAAAVATRARRVERQPTDEGVGHAGQRDDQSGGSRPRPPPGIEAVPSVSPWQL